MNKVIMTGYVVKDPEVNEFKRKRRRNKRASKYGLVASFRLSVRRPFKTKDGTKYDYFSKKSCIIVRFNIYLRINILKKGRFKNAEFIEEYIEKGDCVGIEGILLNDNYENEDGMTMYRDKINLDKIELLRKRKDEDENDYEDEEEEDYDDEFYDEDDYEDDEDDDYEEEYLEEDDEEDDDDEDEEEDGYHRSIRKSSQKKGNSDTRRRNSRIKKPSSRKKSEQRKREQPERRNRQSRKSVPERRRNENKKRNLVDEEFERVQESEYNNYGFD